MWKPLPALGICCLCFILRVAADTHYAVPPGTPGASPAPGYTSWETAATNIQDAVSAATAGDLVLVTNGFYAVTNHIVIDRAITVRSFSHGATDREGTVIDGGYPARTNRCLYINNVDALVDGFTITNGYAPAASLSGRGGGIYIQSKGTVSNCVVSGNQAPGNGGGIYMSGGRVADCRLIGNLTLTNQAAYGGGVHAYGNCVITNCLIRGNVSRAGGGAYLYSPSETVSSVTLVNCDIIGNTAKVVASGEGGAGVGAFRRNHVLNCRIVSNDAVSCGGSVHGAALAPGSGTIVCDTLVADNTGGGYGVVTVGSYTTVSNCVIRNNSGGSCIYLKGGLLANCTVVSNASNMAFVQGGKMRNCLFAGNDSFIWATLGSSFYENCTIVSNKTTGLSLGLNENVTSVVENCILYGNKKNYETTKASAVLIFTNSCTAPLPAGPSDVGNLADPPRFAESGAWNFRLAVSSPCRDKGFPRPWQNGDLDLDGMPRVIGPAVDLGAFELAVRRGLVLSIR